MDWVSGACLLVHRREAEAVGLLDERYFLYTEDVDFCAAMRARGRRILFTPVGPDHASSRAFPRDRAGSDEPRLPPQPDGLLRKAPSALGAGAAGVPAAEVVRLPQRDLGAPPARGGSGPPKLSEGRPELGMSARLARHAAGTPVASDGDEGSGQPPRERAPRAGTWPASDGDGGSGGAKPPGQVRCPERAHSHRRAQAARLRHRDVHPQPAAAPVAARSRRPSTCCSAARRTGDRSATLGDQLPGRCRSARRPTRCSEQFSDSARLSAASAPTCSTRRTTCCRR